MLDPFVFELYLRLKIITQSICYNCEKKLGIKSQIKREMKKINDKVVSFHEVRFGEKINKQKASVSEGKNNLRRE